LDIKTLLIHSSIFWLPTSPPVPQMLVGTPLFSSIPINKNPPPAFAKPETSFKNSFLSLFELDKLLLYSKYKFSLSLLIETRLFISFMVSSANLFLE